MSAVLKWDSNEWRKVRDANLLVWMCGNQSAVDVVVTLSTIAETWDDLYDGDKKVPRDRLNEALSMALVKLQVNAFYKSNEAIFWSLTVAAINAWMDANELQESNLRQERMLAFHIRNFGYEIASMAAFRTGGWEHLRRVSLEMRRFFAHEDYDSWEHRHA